MLRTRVRCTGCGTTRRYLVETPPGARTTPEGMRWFLPTAEGDIMLTCDTCGPLAPVHDETAPTSASGRRRQEKAGYVMLCEPSITGYTQPRG